MKVIEKMKLWKVELDYKEEDDDFGFRQVASEVMVDLPGGIMKTSESTDWNSHEDPGHIPESVTFIEGGEKLVSSEASRDKA